MYGLKSISFWVCFVFLLLTACTAEPLKEIRKISGEIWPETIWGYMYNPRSRMGLNHDGTYHWYGENKLLFYYSAMVGIMYRKLFKEPD